MADIQPKEVQSLHQELETALSARYKILKHLKSGGSGAVFKIRDEATTTIKVAKILRQEARSIPELREEFQVEATKLARLRHPNLVAVFEQSTPSDPPYFVMEYVVGARLDQAVRELAAHHARGRWIHELRRILTQLTDVLGYLHSQERPLLHLDVKPDNIHLNFDYRNKPIPILLDFGLSRYQATAHGYTGARGTYDMWPHKYLDKLEHMTDRGRTVFKIRRNLLNVDLDLHLLGGTIRKVLAQVSSRSGWEPAALAEVQFLENCIRRLDIDDELEPKFASALELRDALRRLELRSSRTRHHFGHGLVRIPERNITSFGHKARMLTDWPRFQRLRGIRQLGLAFLVYPGATHTRFEHSLGVFENALAVLDQLSGPGADPHFRSLASDEELIATAIVALLHDIGHYPLGHDFRVHGKLPNHDRRTLDVLASREAKSRITRAFGSDVYNAVVLLMRSVLLYSEPGRKVKKVSEPKHVRVLRSIISSAIDVDKLDYVSRDALHAGVPYGLVVDRDRLLASLRVWWDKGGDPHLVLSDKGRVCAEALVFARYLMTSEVYWNHGVRAYAAAVSAALDLVPEKDIVAHEWDTDAEFLGWLLGRGSTSWLKELFDNRRPYRRAFVHQRRSATASSEDAEYRLFEFLEKSAGGDRQHSREIKEVVADSLNITDWQSHEIVLDVPRSVARVGGVQVLPEGAEEPGSVGPIFEAIERNFDDFARKARIFIHPRHMGLHSVSESTEVVRSALLTRFGFA